MAPSDPQTAHTDIAGDFLCQGCEAFNNTNIINTAFGVNGLGDKIFQVLWTGAKYAATDNLDLMVGYYEYIQNSFFGTATGGPAHYSGTELYLRCRQMLAEERAREKEEMLAAGLALMNSR